MKSYPLKKQQGAVLAFSLVMLVLLTLVSVSMIKQNKTQINIATNAGQEVTAFASVEMALRQTQAVLENLRYVDADGDGFIDATEREAHHCKSGFDYSIHPVPHSTGTIVGLPANVTATIQAEYCISDYVLRGTTDNQKFAGNESGCLYSYIDNDTGNATAYEPGNWVRNLVRGSIRLPTCPDQADSRLPSPRCTDLPDPSAEPVSALPSSDNVMACEKLNAAGGWSANSPNVNACAIEVYTVHVSLLDEDTNTERTVESKFQIDCSNDLNP